MRVGLWFEPEVIGVDSPAASSLPDEAFFSRFGARVREHDRYHLDFRHPAARAHVDEAIGLAIAEHGVSYLKLDYNINPGAGTERDATAAGDGLLGHARAYREWLESLRVRYPGLLIENCASGAMRADYGLLPAVHLQSTSDQQDPSLYPPIAASAPASILPEQCGNWAYPAAEMSEEETAFTLVTGLSGRLYLSGFLNRLSDGQRAQVAAAAALHKELRDELFTAVPFWPLGLPSWDAERVCLGLRGENRTLLFVWDRAEGASEIRLPGALAQAFPAEGWSVRHDDGETVVTTLEGPTARVLVSEGRA
jgi:alpha-galactosidase